MFCNHCGANIGETAVRCPACGFVVPPVAVQKKLVRPRADRKVAGVCAAFARYFEMDVMIIRLILVLSIIFGAGAGIIAYVIAWIVIPEEPEILLQPVQPQRTV